ncbi:hypothetical protein H5410_048099 [Solanum commersonii]|uniref:Uncharacterized protein n=1 Tax=Solanum commersonii TaxID=4109 RepID=A0A9J5XH39_SOLCO|nr:hypothetical protein H5410_048099 [Solanum commersonii]
MWEYKAKAKYRCSEARDTRKELIYMPIYTNIHQLYTKNGIGLKAKIPAKWAQKEAQIHFSLTR